MAKTPRKAVYKAIDGEREYQDGMKVGPNGRTDGRQKSVGDYLALLDVYVRKAQDAYAGRPGDEPSLHEIRKVAAIAVQCMEVHGALKRESRSEIPSEIYPTGLKNLPKTELAKNKRK